MHHGASATGALQTAAVGRGEGWMENVKKLSTIEKMGSQKRKEKGKSIKFAPKPERCANAAAATREDGHAVIDLIR